MMDEDEIREAVEEIQEVKRALLTLCNHLLAEGRPPPVVLCGLFDAARAAAIHERGPTEAARLFAEGSKLIRADEETVQ